MTRDRATSLSSSWISKSTGADGLGPRRKRAGGTRRSVDVSDRDCGGDSAPSCPPFPEGLEAMDRFPGDGLDGRAALIAAKHDWPWPFADGGGMVDLLR